MVGDGGAVIATEAALFAYLLFSYFYFASQCGDAWPPGGPLELRLALPNTAVLIASSLAFRGAAGHHGRRCGAASQRRAGGPLTWARVRSQRAGPRVAHLGFGRRSDVHGSLFFTITGFHGAHVVVGLAMLLAILLWCGSEPASRRSDIWR